MAEGRRPASPLLTSFRLRVSNNVGLGTWYSAGRIGSTETASMSSLLMVSHGGVHLLALLNAPSLPGCNLNTLRLAFHAIQEADTVGVHRSQTICQGETDCCILGARKYCLGLNITQTTSPRQEPFVQQRLSDFPSRADLDSPSWMAGGLWRSHFSSTPRQMPSHSRILCLAT